MPLPVLSVSRPCTSLDSHALNDNVRLRHNLLGTRLEVLPHLLDHLSRADELIFLPVKVAAVCSFVRLFDLFVRSFV